MKRLTLVSLGVFLVLGVINNVAASLFAKTFGIGLLDLNGGASLIEPAPPDGFPTNGSAQVAAILAAYSPNAAAAHVALMLTLDILFPAAAITFGWAASRTLTVVFHWPRPVAAVGVILSIGYGFGELMEKRSRIGALVREPITVPDDNPSRVARLQEHRRRIAPRISCRLLPPRAGKSNLRSTARALIPSHPTTSLGGS